MQKTLLPPASLVLPLASVAVLGFVTTPTQAQVTEYTNRAAFLAATTGVNTFTFDGYAPANSFTSYPSDLTVQGVTFTDPFALAVVDPGRGDGNSYGNHQFLLDENALSITALPVGTTAFGLDLAGGEATGTVAVTVGGQIFNINVNNGGASGAPVFIGFTSATPVSGLHFSDSSSLAEYGVTFNNVSVGQAAPVPEASSIASLVLMLALGLGGVFVARARATMPRSAFRVPEHIKPHSSPPDAACAP